MKRVSNRKLRRADVSQSIVRVRRIRPLGVSLARFGSAIAVAGALFAGLGVAKAAQQVWSPADANWDLVTPNWDSAALWTNGNDALFNATGVAFPAVNIAVGGVTATNLQFNVAGYSIGGGTLTLNAGSTITANAAASIASSLSGADVTVSGPGLLTLTGSNTFSTGLTLSGGNLAIGSAMALGSTAFTIAGAGSTVQASGGAQSVGNAVSANADFTVTGTNNLTFTGATTLSAARAITLNNTGLTTFGAISGTDTGLTFSGAGNATVTGVIGIGTGALTRNGAGLLTLSGANTYTGTTTAGGGVIRLNNANALPGGIGTTGGTSGLTFNGGVVELANGNFLRNLGTGAAQFQFTGSGGFAAVGAARTVTINNVAATVVTWGAGSFVPNGSSLILGSATADNTLTFSNPIAFGASDRTLEAGNGTALIDGVLAGVLSGTGGLVKTGAGTLSLAATNTYTGSTSISSGVLAVPANVANSTDGPLGNSATDVLIGSGAGLAVQGSATNAASFTVGRNITLQAGATTTGALGTFSAVSGASVTGTYTGTVTLNRDLSVTSSALATTILNGTINGTGRALVKDGAGTVQLSGTNITNFTNGVTTSGGALQFAPGAANTFTQGGPVVNDGVIQASNGTLSFGNTVLTSSALFTNSSLRENRIAVFNDTTSANTGGAFRSSPAQAQVVGTGTGNGWADNTTYAYTGQFFVFDTDLSGSDAIQFGKSFDDATTVVIDGVVVLSNPTFNATTKSGLLNLAAGWHSFDLRLGQGSGGYGAVTDAVNGWGPGQNLLGFGINLTGVDTLAGNQYVDFNDARADVAMRTATSMYVVDSGATLTAGGVTNAGAIVFNNTATAGTVQLTAAGTSDTQTLQTTGTGTGGVLNLGAGVTLNTANLLFSTGSTLTFTGGGTLNVGNSTDATSDFISGFGTGATLKVDAGIVNLNKTTSGAAGLTLNLGTATTNVNASTTIGTLNSQASTTPTVSIVGAGTVLTVNAGTYAGAINGAGSLNKGGTGTLILSGTNTYGGTTTISGGILRINTPANLPSTPVVLSGGTFDLLNNASTNFGYDITVTASSTINVDRAAGGVTVNRTHSLHDLSIGNQTLTVTNPNGFGLAFTGATTLTAATPTFSVGTASASNVIQGLTLSGPVTGSFGLNKAGAGTLVLGSATNSFGGSGSIIDVTQGVLSVATDGALGDPANVLRLTPSTGTSAFRATDTFTLNHTLAFGNATSVRQLEVVEGKTLTLANSFDVSAATTADLEIRDQGTVYFGSGANNSTWGGRLLVRGGTIKLDASSNANALGIAGVANISGDTVLSSIVAGTNAALTLEGGITVSEFLTFGGQSGFNQTGALRNVSGSNTVNTALFIGTTAAATIGADTGSTLNLTGGINGGTTGTLTLTGGGTIKFTGTAITNASMPITLGRPTADNAGGVLIGMANSTYTPAITVNRGTLTVGDTTTGLGSVSGTGLITLSGNGALTVDDTTAAVASRLNAFAGTARAVTFAGGTFNYIANGTAASSETLGALTSAHGASTISVSNSGSADSTLTFANLASNVVSGGSVLTFGSTNSTFGATANKVIFTTAPTLTPATTGIMQRVVVIDGAGTNFASYNHDGVSANTNGIQAFTGYNTTNSAIAAAATATMKLTADTNLAGNNKTLNALYLSGTGVDLTSTVKGATNLTLTSGNILVGGGANTIASGVILDLSTEGGLLVSSGSSLAVNGVLRNAANVTKGLAGNLSFNNKQYFNTGANYFTVLGGTVTLNGGDNTLYQGVQGGTAGQHLSVGFGATLDLNGTAQLVGDLRTPNSSASIGGGGTITSTAAATLVTANVASTWGGQITGNIFYTKTGANALTVVNSQTYTGGTLINGGTLTLQDAGRITGTAPISVNYAAFNLSDGGTIALSDRVNDAAALTFRGASVIYTGRDATNSSETLGNVTFAAGNTRLQVANGALGTIRSTVLSLGTVTNSGDATVLLENSSGQIGSNPRMTIANGTSLLVNGIIPWASQNATELVGYLTPSAGNATGGTAAINQPGYQGYDATTFGASSATQNLRLASANFTVPDVNGGSAGTYAANAIAFAATAGNTISFADGNDTLNLTAGTLLASGNVARAIGSTVGNGHLAAGGTQGSGTARLHLSAQGGNTLTMNSNIVDNGSGASTRLVATIYNGATISLASANTYTGGTVVNGGQAFTGILALNVSGANGGSTVAIPNGDLFINAATVQLSAANQIHFSVNPTLNGQGTLNLNGFAQTLAGLTFNNDGGTAPTVTLGTGTLSLTGNVAAASSNAGSIATITSAGIGTLDLNGTSRTFNVAPVTVNGSTSVASLTPTLNVGSATMIVTSSTNNSTTGIVKTGNGLLQLSGANTFGGGVDLQTGGLALNANSTPSTVGATVTAGPLGTGTLTIGANTRLLAAAASTVANATTVNGSFTADGILALTLNGATTLAATPTVTVTAPQMVTSIGGLISGGFGITKDGLGTLTLSNAAVANTYTGVTTVNNGILSISGNNSLGADPGSFVASQLTIQNGAILAATNSPVLAANRGVTIGTGGGAFSPATSLRLDGRITGSSQTLSMIGAGSLVVNANNSSTFTGSWNANAGTLTAIGPNALAGQAVNLNGGVLSLLWDGTTVNSGGTPETAAFNNALTMNTAAATINVDRALLTFAPLSQTAGNKTMQVASLAVTIPNSTLTVTNGNGNGLAVAGALALPLTGVTTFSVGTASSSPVVQGLTLNGLISGGNTGAANVVLAKSGAGALVLGSASNSFGGSSSIIDITAGILQVASNGALGDSSNVVRISTNSATAGLRATGTFSTARSINLNNTANGIDVTSGNTLTLTSPFTFGTGGVTNALAKNDNGVLDINADNSTWTGVLTISDGAVKVSNNGALGVAANNTVVAGNTSLFGSALQLNGVNIAELLTLNGSGSNVGGALQAMASTSNTESGAITLATTSAIGAESGSTLNLTGGISGAFGLTLVGAGNININTAALGAVTAITKLNSGTTTIGVASTSFVGNMTLNGGTFVVGSAGVGSVGGTGAITLSESASLKVDDSGGSAVVNRLGGNRTLSMQVGATTLEYVTNTTGASSETLGALTVGTIGGATLKVTNNGTQNSTLIFASLNGANAYTLNVVNGGSGAGFGTAANKIVFTAAPTLVGGAVAATNGLLARATVSGTDFATYNTDGTTTNTNGLQAYAAYQNNVNINAAAVAVTDTFRVSSATTNSTVNTQTRTLNAVKIDGATDLTLGASAGSASSTLTLTSGGVLATGGGNHSIGGGLTLAFGANEALFHVNAGSTLTVNGALTGSSNFQKALGGTLTLNAPIYISSFTSVNGGTLKLAPGGTNTLFPNTNLFVATGGTLDLNGGVQFVGDLASQGGSGVGSTIGGGTITTTGGASTLLANVNTGDRRFAGQITGNIFFARANGSATARNLVLSNDNNYTGGTLIMGGIGGSGSPGGVVLVDGGRLSGTSAITINFGTLSLNNFGTTDLLDRVNDSAPITLNGGAINYNGRAGAISSETLGAVTLASGANTISSANSSQIIAPQASTLTLTSLSRNASAGATVEFSLNHTGSSSATLGSLGASSTNIVVSGGVPLTNNLVGPWAVVHTSFFNTGPVEFASYIGTLGIGALSQTGFAGYDGTAFPAANQPTQNIRLSGAAAVPTGGIIVNALNVAGTGTSTNFNLTFANANDVLNLASGGLIVQGVNNTSTIAGSIGTAALPGKITAGGASPTGTTDLDFFYYNSTAANVLTVNSAIVDNPNTQPVRLVTWGANIGTDFGAATIILASNANTWSGGTIINQETLQIGAAGTPGNLPGGGLTINGGTVTQNNGTIASQAVALNGNAVLTLAGTNSLSRLAFNNNGGNATTAPSVAAGTLLNLSANGTTSTTAPIYAQSSNPGSVATISGTALDFGSQLDSASNNRVTLVVDPIQVNSQNVAPLTATLNISAPLQGVGTSNTGSITKTGNGLLQLSATTSAFSGGVNVTAGGLIIGGISTPNTRGSVVTSGPLGTGTLTMAGGTTLLGSAAQTIANALVFSGNINFQGANNLTFNGPISLPGSLTLDIANPAMTTSLLGPITGGAGGITKTGLGTLVLSTFGGAININGGNLSLLTDGSGTGSRENLSFGGITSSGPTNLTIGRLGTTYLPLFTTALNKTIQVPTLTTGGFVLTVSNNNGYGIEVTGATALTADQTYNVVTASGSNVVQGLTLSGITSGNFNLTKTGAGALVLNNAGNTFGSAGKVIDLQGGILSVASNGALGDGANVIQISTNAATAAGLRATDSFSTGRTIKLNAAANAIEVTANNSGDLKTLTLTAPFTFSAASNALAKNDNGILELNANNVTSGWTGATTVNAGAILVSNANGLGGGAVSVVNFGSALQLSGNISVSNALTLNASSNQFGGINSGGSLQSVSGANTYSGAITQTSGTAATLGANSLATLNITGTYSSPGANTLGFQGAGTINFQSVLTTTSGLFQWGTGTTTLSAASPLFVSVVTVNAGTFKIAGSGAAIGGTGLVTVNGGGTLTLDDSAGTPIARLAGRPVTLTSGAFNYTGNTANSAESLGALNFNQASTITSNQTGAGTVTLTFASIAFSANSTSGVLSGTNLGTATNKIIITAAPTTVPATSGILSRFIITSGASGFDFVSYNHTGLAANAFGLQPFANYNVLNNIDTAAATDSLNITATPTFTAGKTLNAIKITGTGITVGGTVPALSSLTLTSGGIAVTGGANTISVPVLSVGANEEFVHVNAGATLNLNSTLTGTVGFTKADGGLLILNPSASAIAGVTPSTISGGSLAVNGGTLQLASNNAYTPNQFLRISPNSTLDLNGKLQSFQGVFTDAGVAQASPGSLGTITSSAGTGNLATNDNATARNWAGRITGSVNFLRSGLNTLSVFSDNDYTGNTTINGNTITLKDAGRLSGTSGSGIAINYATLNIDNTGTLDLMNRVNDSAAIALRGASLTFLGRAQTASSETLGAVTLAQGNSTITVTVGATGVNSADLTLTSLNRAVGDGTVNFMPTGLGLIGSAARLLIPTINSVSTSTYGGGLTNNIIGGWAIINTDNFASYIPGLGIGRLDQTGYAGYSTNILSAAAGATDNIKVASGATSITADTTINSVKFDNGVIGTVSITAGQTLTLASGGFLNFTSTAWNFGSGVNVGNLTSGGPELFIYTQGGGTPTINSVITDRGVNPVALVKSGANTLTLAATNTFTGGTTVNQGILNVATTGVIPLAATPANGLIISGATVTLNAAGSIAPGNIVTLNGNGTLNLFGNNTLSGLSLNNIGGGAGTPTVNTSSAGATGTLTLGAGGFSATSSNATSTAVVVGRLDLGAAPATVVVDPIAFNGIDINPLQGTVAIQGMTGNAGGFTKSGLGSIRLDAQQVYTGPTNVTGGGLISNLGASALTGPAAGSRYSAYTFAAGTRFNLLLDAVIGSLAGAGTVTNSSTSAKTFGVGFDNTSTTFSGQFVRFNDVTTNPFALTKLGTGTMTLTGVSNDTNAFVVQGGGVTLSGAGRTAFVTNTVNATGALTLDNRNAAGGNQNSRVVGPLNAGTLTLAGGNFVAFGNETAATPTTETIGTLTFGSGGSTMTFNADPANPLTFTVGTAFSAIQGGGSALLRGAGFGSAPGNGVPTIAIGALALGAPAGTGTGLNGSQTMPIRPDLIGGNTATSPGTAFITKDSVGNFLRPLTAAEMAPTLTTATSTAVNVGLSTNNALTGTGTTATNTAFSLTLNSGGGVSLGAPAAFGLYAATAGLVQTKIGSGGFLALNGNLGIASGQIDTSTNTALYFHTAGVGTTLPVSGYLGTTAGGLVKTGDGSMTINNAAYYTGATTVNAGTLTIGSGIDNSIQVVPTAATPTLSNLTLNGGALELNGTSQLVGTLSSTNPYAGGSIKNSAGGPAATLTTSTGAATFGGTIDGNLNFVKTGNALLTLTNTSTYGGTTTIRGNTLSLRDGGILANTTAVNVNFAGLTIDQSALNPVGLPNPVRIPVAAPLALQGATLTLTGGGSVDSSATFNTVNLQPGYSFVTATPQAAQGATATVNIGSLVQTSVTSAVNFNAGGTIGTGGFGNGNIVITSITPAGGVSTPIASMVVNGMLPAWISVQANDFATFNANGLVKISYTGGITTQLTGLATTGVENIATNVAQTGNLNNLNVNSLNLYGANTYTFNAAQGVTLTSGGLMAIQTTPILGNVANNGFLTSVNPQLYVNDTTNFTINSAIQNNTAPANTVTLVKNGVGILTLGGTNTYGGGTFVNAGTLTLAATGTLPGSGLTLNNANFTQTAAGIVTQQDVAINGGGVLTMAGSNTLNKVTFVNNGGTATPSVVTSTLLTLSAADAVTSTNDNLGSVPTISGALAFNNALPVISTSGAAPNDLVISALITTPGGGPISKQGTGSLVLSGANTFTTGFKLDGGTLIFGVGTTGTVTNGPVGTGTLTIGNGTTIFSTNNFTIANAVSVTGDFTFGGTTTIGTNHNTTLSGVVTLGAGGHAMTVTSPFVTDTISGQVTGGTDLSKGGPGTLVLSSAANNYGGGTTVTGGLLKSGVANAIPNASLLTVNAGAVYDLNNFSQISQQIAGGGVITNSGAAVQTFTLGGTSATDVITNLNSTFAGSITNAVGALNLQVVGLGNVTLSGFNNYSGTTTIKTGTLTGGATNAFSPNSSVTIGNGLVGAASTQGVLDATNFSQVIGALSILTDSANGNMITIGTGNTLTITGNVLVGETLAAPGVTTTRLTPTGGGTLTVNNAAANASFTIGGQTGATAGAANTATVDLSGLSAFNAALNTTTGIFRVANLSSAAVTGGVANLILPATTNITTATLAVGDGSQFNNNADQVNTLKLGSGVTTINANTINIGTGGRDIGSVTFTGASGTVTVRDATGTGRASFNVGTNGATTGTTHPSANDLVDFTGHSADLLLGTLAVMNQARIGALNADFKFDTGTLDATGVQLGFRTGSAPTNGATLAGTLSIGGGSVIIGTGGVELGNNTNTSTTAAAINGVLNISGGTVSIANSAALGGAIRLGNNTAASGAVTASGALNISGGTTTLAGDMIRGTTPRTTSTLSLTGGTLDLATHNIGTTALPIATTFAAGTLANLGELNGGGATAPLTKTTGGTLILAGTNTYTGPTNVTAGTLLINGLQGSATGAVTVSPGATLGGTGTIGGATTIQDGGNLKPGASAGLLTFASNLTLGGNTTNSTFELQSTARGTVGGYDAINLGASSTLTYAGILTLDISSTLPNGTYDLFSFTNPPSGSFFNVTLTGSAGYTGDLTNSGGVWTGASQGSSFTFTEATGDLLVVPEPSALVSLLGGLGVLLGFRRARRRG